MAKAKKDKADREQGLYRREEGLSKLSAAERKAMEAYAADYMGFLGEAKTERLAYRASVALLEKNGFRPIGGFKTLKPGDKVYRGYHGKTLLAAVIGSSPLGEGLNVVGRLRVFRHALLRRHQEVPVGRPPARPLRRRLPRRRHDGRDRHRRQARRPGLPDHGHPPAPRPGAGEEAAFEGHRGRGPRPPHRLRGERRQGRQGQGQGQHPLAP